MIRSINVLAMVLAFFVASTSAHARIVKCVDGEGKVTYSDMGCSTSRQSKVIVYDNTTNGMKLKENTIRQGPIETVQNQKRDTKEQSPVNSYEQKAKERSVDMDARSGKYSEIQIRAMREAIKLPESRNLIMDIKSGGISDQQLITMFNLKGVAPKQKKNKRPPMNIPETPPHTPTSTWISDCNQGGCWGTDGKHYDRSGSGYFPSGGGTSCYEHNGMMQCP